jgi:hypothetical protein
LSKLRVHAIFKSTKYKKEGKTMKIYKAGNKVGKGTYWDLTSGKRIDVEEEAILSGGASSTYLRMSTGAMLVAGPVVGLLYVICLPFIGIATVATLAAKRIGIGIVNVIGRSLSFGWRPGEAYLAGKKKGKKETK